MRYGDRYFQDNVLAANPHPDLHGHNTFHFEKTVHISIRIFAHIDLIVATLVAAISKASAEPSCAMRNVEDQVRNAFGARKNEIFGALERR